MTPRLEGSTTKKADRGSGSSVIARPMSISVRTTAPDLNATAAGDAGPDPTLLLLGFCQRLNGRGGDIVGITGVVFWEVEY
jgi:hypothetical protein